MADSLKARAQKQTVYKRLPRIVRYLLLGLAFLLLPAGVIAMFTPLAVLEVGSLFIFTSLTILSFEFDWARNLLSWFKGKLTNKTVRKRLTLFMLVVVSAYIVVAFLLFMRK